MKQCAYAGEGAREHSLQQAGLSVSAVKVSILLFGAVEAVATGTVCQP